MYKNLAAALAAACFFTPVSSQTAPRAEADKPLSAAFVYVTPVFDVGWTHQHDAGRKAAEAALGGQLKTTVVADVAEGPDAERVLRDLARQGNRLIFTTSFGYTEPVLRVARDFPDVKFESITGYRRAANVATANARYYEGRYLSGIAAARMSRSGVAGYVAGFPIPEVLQGINAFTLGMRSVRPDARVKVVWLDTWFDPARERDAAMTLMNQGADVLAFHSATNAVMVAAQERGKFAIAYHSDMRQVAPDAQILAVTHQWGDYYARRARAVRDGSWTSGDVWGGVGNGMIRVEAFGRKVPAAVQKEVLAQQQRLAQGRLQPFAATRADVRDNAGHVVIAKGSQLSDAQILDMKWLVEGVQASPAR